MMIQPWHWFILGIVLVTAEIYTATFAILWFGIASLIVSAMLWFAPELLPTWQSQLFAWSIMSILSAICWFKFAEPMRKSLKARKALQDGVLIGETGMIIKPPMFTNSGNVHHGIVRFNVPKVGITEWPCYDIAGAESDLKMGQKVLVVDVVDTKLMIKKFED